MVVFLLTFSSLSEGRQVASLFLSFAPPSYPLLFGSERDTQLFLVIRMVFTHL